MTKDEIIKAFRAHDGIGADDFTPARPDDTITASIEATDGEVPGRAVLFPDDRDPDGSRWTGFYVTDADSDCDGSPIDVSNADEISGVVKTLRRLRNVRGAADADAEN